MLITLVQSGILGVDAHADALGLKPYSGWFSTGKAGTKDLIRKVCNLSKSQTSSQIGQRVDDILFKAKYRPSDIGGSNWVKNNHGAGLKSVYDPGLGTTVNWGSSGWGCYSYAMYVSRYVRGSNGRIVSTGKGVVPTVSQVKKLFETYADPGEHVRYYYKSPSGSNTVHSVAYLASDKDGFYFSSENGDYLKISVHYCTYSYIQKKLRVQSGQGSIFIYDTNGGRDMKNGKVTVTSDSVIAKPKLSYSPDTSAYKVAFSRSLSYNGSDNLMMGTDVKYAQACLHYLGYDIQIDGVFGSGTAYTVRQFQSHYGMASDGIIGSASWAALEKAVKNNPAPVKLEVKTHPKNTAALPDSNVTFSVTATGNKLTYQWYYKKSGDSSWTLWKNRTSASFTTLSNSTWNGMQVYCKVTDGSGKSVNSKTATITISTEMKITEQPKSRTIVLGEPLTVSVKAQGIGLSYQWYYKKKTESTWSSWERRTHASETVTPNATWDGIQLYCRVKDSSGKSLNSVTAIITMNREFVITEQPKNRTINLGEPLTVSVKATGEGLSYQWYYKKADEIAWSKWTARTHASETVTPNETCDGIQLYCKVKDSSGQTRNSVSAVVKINASLRITEQPKDQTISLGNRLTVSVKAQGAGLSYQWYYKKAGKTAWSEWDTATHASETLTPDASWNGIQLFCKVRDASGKSVNSVAAVITVTEGTSLAILSQPESASVMLGESVTVSVKAQGKGLSYQWYHKKIGNSSWTVWTGRTHATETVTPNETWNGMQLYCKVTDSSGKTVGSSVAVITVSADTDPDEMPVG